MILIRKAKLADVKEIIKISIKGEVKKEENKEGLIEYETPSEEEYKKRVEKGRFIYVLEDNGKIVGFLAGYGFDELKKFNFSKDRIVGFLRMKPELFVYADVLCIEKKYRRQRLGEGAIQTFMEDARNKKYEWMYGAVCHKPKNAAAAGLMIHLGFRCREEIEARNGLRFGIYDKRI